MSPRREHSRKPDEIREDIERLVPGPYVELFARHTKPGWDAWGNQTTRFNPPAFDDILGEAMPQLQHPVVQTTYSEICYDRHLGQRPAHVRLRWLRG